MTQIVSEEDADLRQQEFMVVQPLNVVKYKMVNVQFVIEKILWLLVIILYKVKV